MARRTSRTSLQPARPSGSSPSGSSPPGRSRTCSENVGTDSNFEFGASVFSRYVNVIIPIDRLDVFSITTGAATSMPTTRWFAVGSAGESEREAGVRAADEALVHDDAKLLIAFCSPSHDLPALVRQIHARSGGVALIGCTTAGDQQEIIRGAYGVLGAAVPLVGGCADDDLEMTGTFQLYGDQVLTDSVVAAGIASDAPLGIGVRHGWQRVGEPMLVTRSEGNQVYALDDRPALDVYLKQSGAVGPECSNAGAFIRLAMT